MWKEAVQGLRKATNISSEDSLSPVPPEYKTGLDDDVRFVHWGFEILSNYIFLCVLHVYFITSFMNAIIIIIWCRIKITELLIVEVPYTTLQVYNSILSLAICLLSRSKSSCGNISHISLRIHRGTSVSPHCPWWWRQSRCPKRRFLTRHGHGCSNREDFVPTRNFLIYAVGYHWLGMWIKLRY